MESIAEGLKALEAEIEGFKMENLCDNEAFVSALVHASRVAIRNHQEEKLEALRNAVLNAALPNAPEESSELMFLDFVDSFTPWHIKVLARLDKSEIVREEER